MHLIYERRSWPRAPALFRVEDRAGGAWMMAQDIGLGGMLVTTPQPRWPGELLRVRFMMPGQLQAVRATCRVLDLREAPRGVALGTQFLRLHPEAQLALHAWVSRHVEAEVEHAGRWIQERAAGVRAQA